jgi:hypothetical protein
MSDEAIAPDVDITLGLAVHDATGARAITLTVDDGELEVTAFMSLHQCRALIIALAKIGQALEEREQADQASTN